MFLKLIANCNQNIFANIMFECLIIEYKSIPIYMYYYLLFFLS